MMDIRLSVGCWLNVLNTQCSYSSPSHGCYFPGSGKGWLLFLSVFFQKWIEFNKCTYSEGDGWQCREFLSPLLMRVIGYTTSYIFSKDTMRILLKERKEDGRRSSASSPAVSNLSSTRALTKPRSKRRTSRLLHKLILTSGAITMAATLTQPRPCHLEDHPQLSDLHIITTEKGGEKGLFFSITLSLGRCAR